MIKRILSASLALAICLVMASPAFAYDTGTAGVGSTVSRGGSTTAVIDTNGVLWMWGDNNHGQLGNGGDGNGRYYEMGQERITQTVPTRIMDNVASVSAGNIFAAALKTDGSLWTWGSNKSGQLGDGKVAERNTPSKIMDNVAAVSCGAHRAVLSRR